MSNQITALSATDLAKAIRVGKYSAKEVLEAYIQRIEKINPKLNALVIPQFASARQRAIELDNEQALGNELGPLHGVPVTIKEQFKVKGTQTTLGATNKIGRIDEQEGPLVQALRKAGAVVLGKTNIMQTLAGMESTNRVYGQTNNPWNINRTPGGSSGGESAMVAAQCSPLGLAGDYGGSTRIPAYMCGVFGLKPTAGRLSNDDFPKDLLGYGQELFIPQPGPIARTTADIDLAMKIFCSAMDGTTSDVSPPIPWKGIHEGGIKGWRFGYYTDNGYFSPSPAVKRAVVEAVAALKDLGAEAVEIEPPNTNEWLKVFLGAISAGGGAAYKDLLGKEKPIKQVEGLFLGVNTPSPVLKIVKNIYKIRGQKYLASIIDNMKNISTEDYWKLTEFRTDLRQKFHDLMREQDLKSVICPVYALPAPTHGATEHLMPAASYSIIYNAMGAPAGVVPITRVREGEESERAPGKDMADITARKVEEGSAGLPVGVQVVSSFWREDLVLTTMAALEDYFKDNFDFPVISEQ